MEKTHGLKRNMVLFMKSIKIMISTSRICTVSVLVLSVVGALVAPINAIIYQKFLDSVVKMIGLRTWTNSGVIWLSALTLLSILFYSSNHLLSFIKQVLADKVDISVTEKILDKAISLPMKTFDNAEVYNHINRAITQTSSSCMQLLEATTEIVYAIVKGTSFMYIIFHFSWPLAIVSLVSLPSVLHVSTKINTYLYKMFYDRAEKKRLIEYLKLLMVKNEYVKEIKLYGVGKKIISIIQSNFTSFLHEDIYAKRKFLVKKVGVQATDDAVNFCAKMWLLMLAIQKNCSLGTIILYFSSLDNLKYSYLELINHLSSLQNCLLYMESLDVLEHEKSCNETGESKFCARFNEIEFRNVSFRYPGCDNFVLKNISLKFKRGETYFIVGFNGSGKTTLMKLLLRLYSPTEGMILIDGKDIQEFDLEDYYLHISAIFQDFVKYPFDVYENIAIRCQNDAQNRFKTVLNTVGMQNFVEKLPQKEHTLLMRDWTGGTDVSQGQWQKIAIARCMFSDSIISILDEPFSSIDAEAETQIISNLRKRKDSNLMIFITHRFSSISLTDQIIVLKEGHIAEKGTHEDLMCNEGTYYKLYVAQKLD